MNDIKNKKCIIFSAGDYFGLCNAVHTASGEDLIIAADAGYMNCCQSGLTPNIIIGDFDSMEEPKLSDNSYESDKSDNIRSLDVAGKSISPDIIRVPVEKDDTDTMLAIKLGLERGCTEFHLYGATGGSRLDHTLANLQGLAYLSDNGARGYIYDNNYVFTTVKDSEITIKKPFEWALLSIFCMGKPAEHVSICGAQYPLDDGELNAFFPLGVSNHFGTGDSVRIRVEDACLLISWELKKQ